MYLDKYEDVISKSIYLQNTWEPSESGIFLDFIKPGDAIVDIGAHIGWYSLLARTKTSDDGIIYAIEPEPRSYKILCENIKLNNYHNIIPINKAIGEKNELKKLYYNLYKNGPSVYQLFPISNESHIDVELITLDEIIGEEHVDIIKIDVEGYEVKVLQGAKNILSRNDKPIFFSEFWMDGLKKAGNTNIEYFEIFNKNGYKILIINDNSYSEITYEEAIKLNFANLILIPENRV